MASVLLCSDVYAGQIEKEENAQRSETLTFEGTGMETNNKPSPV